MNNDHYNNFLENNKKKFFKTKNVTKTVLVTKQDLHGNIEESYEERSEHNVGLIQNFRKVQIMDFLDFLYQFENNNKMLVLKYIIDNMNSKNEFIKTQKQISIDLKISLITVKRTFKELQELNFLSKFAKNYAINHYLVCSKYNNIYDEKLSKEHNCQKYINKKDKIKK